MDFTEIYKQSASLVAFSPAGNLILTAAQDRLIVRRTDTSKSFERALLTRRRRQTTRRSHSKRRYPVIIALPMRHGPQIRSICLRRVPGKA